VSTFIHALTRNANLSHKTETDPSCFLTDFHFVCFLIIHHQQSPDHRSSSINRRSFFPGLFIVVVLIGTEMENNDSKQCVVDDNKRLFFKMEDLRGSTLVDGTDHEFVLFLKSEFELENMEFSLDGFSYSLKSVDKFHFLFDSYIPFERREAVHNKFVMFKNGIPFEYIAQKLPPTSNIWRLPLYIRIGDFNCNDLTAWKAHNCLDLKIVGDMTLNMLRNITAADLSEHGPIFSHWLSVGCALVNLQMADDEDIPYSFVRPAIASARDLLLLSPPPLSTTPQCS